VKSVRRRVGERWPLVNVLRGKHKKGGAHQRIDTLGIKKKRSEEQLRMGEDVPQRRRPT